MNIKSTIFILSYILRNRVMSMLFEVKSGAFFPTPSLNKKAYLMKNSWNDWFKYETLFSLEIVSDQKVHYIGQVKIGQFGMETVRHNYITPNIQECFEQLDTTFFSLGQDADYYENLNNLGADIRNEVLYALNDVALDKSLFERAINEPVMKSSLLRYVTPASVRGQYRRLAHGDASLTEYKFKYVGPENSMSEKLELTFEVTPESNPPTNLHVMVGRNGVGKTHILNNMIMSLIQEETQEEKQDYGVFLSEIESDAQELFASLVFVSFSAFDNSKPASEEREDKLIRMKYSYVGLRQVNKKNPKSVEMLSTEFKESLEVIRKSSKERRWLSALETLEADPVFKNIGISNLINDEDSSNSAKVFDRLSSGHKVVLLTITKLIETVEERTLVLLDEPEGHLHPPLLSAFIRALSDLLRARNGVAIIATHSPVVLQEVPRSCIWILRRNNREGVIERPEIETFGENVGVLTREVFGLEVTQSGFHKLLKEAVEAMGDFDEAINYFKGELGMEAKAIIRALLIYRNGEE